MKDVISGMRVRCIMLGCDFVHFASIILKISISLQNNDLKHPSQPVATP